MRRRTTKSLSGLFLTRTLVIGVLVLCATLATLAYMSTSHHVFSKQVRAIDLARAIDNIAMVTATSAHIQQYVDSTLPDIPGHSVRVIDKDSLKVIATSKSWEYQKNIADIIDSGIASASRAALETGRFFTSRRTRSGHLLTILPLTSSRHALAGHFAIEQARLLKPEWHRTLQPGRPTVSDNFFGLFGASRSVDSYVLQQPRSEYGGIIVIDSELSFASGLREGGFYGSALLACIGLSLVVFSSWYVGQRYALSPVRTLSNTLKMQRKGKGDARAPGFEVREFDQFSRQWNGLLNFKQAAEERHRVLSKVLESAPIGFAVTTPDALIEYANPAYLELTGYTLIDVIGKTPDKLLSAPDDDKSWLQVAQGAMAEGKPWHTEQLCRRKDGSEFESEVTLFPVMSAKGELERIISMRQDISARKDYERSLIAAREASEEAERSKSEFIARMSHELRTPFNSIIGFAEIIAKEQLGPVGNDSYLEFAKIIEQSSRGLLGIINSIIDLSKMAAGKRSLDECAVKLPIIVSSVARACNGDADEIDIKITNHLDGCDLLADEALIEHMLNNVVSNAIKFNKPGGQVEIAMSANADGRIVIEVIDTGVGIPETEIANVIKPFVQLSTVYNREHEGIGLGLSLAKNQAKLHGAKLSIESKVEQGTTVRITFPAERTIRPADEVGAEITSAKDHRAA